MIYSVLSHSHLLVFRTLDWIAYLIISILVYDLFRNIVPRNLLLVCILFGNFSIKRYPMTLSYNTFSILLLILAANLLYTGLVKNKKGKILFAGTVVGVNVFFRVPNILQIGLIVCIIWFNVICAEGRPQLILKITLFLIGLLGSVVVVLVFMWWKIGIENIVYSISQTVKIATNSNQAHGISNMMIKGMNQLKSYGIAFSGLILPVVVMATASVLIIDQFIPSQRKGNRGVNSEIDMLSLVIGLCVLVPYSILVLPRKLHYAHIVGIIGVGACLVSILTSIIYSRQNPEVSLVSMVVLMIGLSMSIGSDNVLDTYTILMAPLFCGYVCSLYSIISGPPTLVLDKSLIVIKTIKLASMALILTTLIGWIGIWGIQLVSFTYRDGKPAQLKYTVEAPELNGMKTSYDRAEALNEFYNVMSNEDLKGLEMIVLGRFPLAFISVENKNYFSNPWIDLQSVTKETLYEQIKTNNMREIKPIIVFSYLWSHDQQIDFFKNNEKYDMIIEYMEDHSYSNYYTSNNFAIYKPN